MTAIENYQQRIPKINVDAGSQRIPENRGGNDYGNQESGRLKVRPGNAFFSALIVFC